MHRRSLALVIPIVATVSSCVDYGDWPAVESSTGPSEDSTSVLDTSFSTSTSGSVSSKFNPAWTSSPSQTTTTSSDTPSEASSSSVTTTPTGTTSSEKGPEDTEITCIEIDDGNNSEMSSRYLGLVQSGSSINVSGVVQSPLSPCDEEDYFSFDITGEVAKIRIEINSTGFGAISASIRKSDSKNTEGDTYPVDQGGVHDLILPNGRYYLKIAQPAFSAKDVANYTVSVQHLEGSTIAETVNPGSTVHHAEPIGDLEKLTYSIPRAQGYVGSFDESDYYLFTREDEEETEAFFGISSKFGSPTLSLGYVQIVEGKATVKEIKSLTAKPGIFGEMRAELSEWMYYVLVISSENRSGSDYKIHIGPEWTKVNN